jgi:hypothetical protein
MPEGNKGGSMVVNSLTDMGRMLLEVDDIHRKMGSRKVLA